MINGEFTKVPKEEQIPWNQRALGSSELIFLFRMYILAQFFVRGYALEDMKIELHNLL